MIAQLFAGLSFDEVVSWLPRFNEGFLVSIQVTILSLAVGMPLGFVLALGVAARNPALRGLALAVVEIGRGAPALIVLQFVYFGLPSAGLSLTAFAASIVALGWNTGAYTSEMIRAGLDSVPAGQVEAGHALGMSQGDLYRYVLVPQGIRVAMPPLMAFSILQFQATSLCFAISLSEIVSKAYQIGTMTFQYFPALVVAGLYFAAVSIPASLLVNWMESRAAAYSQT